MRRRDKTIKESSALSQSSRKLQTWLEELRSDLARLPVLAQAEADAVARRDLAVENARRQESALAIARQAEAETSRELQYTDLELQAHALVKPGFWARLFRTRTAREW